MLDLKFILHHGEFIIQRMAVGQELLGSDVNLVHRLLKNSVGAETGWSAYALCTQAAIDAVTLPSEFLHQQSETYEHLGEVQTYSYDLRARYSTMVEGRRVKIDPKDADVVFEVTVKAAPHVVWSWLNEPQRMVQWMGVKDVKPETRPEGRVGIGSRNHCVHGKSAMLQTVLDWRPYEYFTLENLGPMTLVMSFILEPVDSGTHLRLTVRPQTKVPRFAARQICRMAMRSAGMQDKLETLANLCAGECAGPGNMVALAVPTQ
jgi:uncharacterized protein YndB with AHSA1/START domain